jgi:hypothetical protein
MNTFTSKITEYLKPTAQAAVPVMVLLILVMMLVPLPALLLDMLFTLNIGMAILVLIAALNIKNFKDFVSFPTLLLVTTLMRLSLNVASTRIVLLEGHSGTDAAGKVIEAFGKFLIGGNFTVGVVIFILITIINFVVITKGSGRVAEVSARFALDSMPGKQMAIDADLNAGLIKQEEAKQRRAEVARLVAGCGGDTLGKSALRFRRNRFAHAPVEAPAGTTVFRRLARGVQPQVPDLGLAGSKPMKDASVAHQPTPHAAADGDIKYRIAASTRAHQRLSECGDVRIVLHEHRQLR